MAIHPMPARLRRMPWRRRKVAAQPWAEAILELAIAEGRMPDENYYLVGITRDNQVDAEYRYISTRPQKFRKIKDAHYTLMPRPDELGGGWRVNFMVGETEVGGAVFPAGAEAYNDAQETAEDWLASRS